MNRIESAVTSVAGQMTALEVGAGIVPVAAATPHVTSAQRTVTWIQMATFTVPTILQVTALGGGDTAATEYTTFMGESSGLSVGDLLQARRGL